MTKKLLLLLVMVLPAFAGASDGGHSGGFDDHTKKTIMYQAVNVVILIAALFYFLKDGVVKHFVDRKNAYLGAAEKAQAIRRAAEQDHAQVKVQLTKLESTADESVARARAEAADMRTQLIAEAEAASARIREEAGVAAKIEIERARAALREHMISEAAKAAEQNFREKVSGEEHRRLQGDFVHNIEAVQS